MRNAAGRCFFRVLFAAIVRSMKSPPPVLASLLHNSSVLCLSLVSKIQINDTFQTTMLGHHVFLRLIAVAMDRSTRHIFWLARTPADHRCLFLEQRAFC